MPDSEPNIIYIVDDEPAVPELIGKMLLAEDASYSVETFSAAEAALERIAQREPSVLVADIWMPGTDGMELLRRTKDAHPEVEVIMVTAHASVPTAVQALEHEAFAYIEKPFQSEQLNVAVRRALSKRRLLRVARSLLEKRDAGIQTPQPSAVGAGSFYAAAWEYLPGEALVLDTSLRIVSANRAARARFNLGRRVRPRVQDIVGLEGLVEAAAAATAGGTQATVSLPKPVAGRTVRVCWAEFLDGVKFLLVWFGAGR